MAHSARGRKKVEQLSKEQAQHAFLEARAAGQTVAEAAKAAHRTTKAIEYWRKTDPEFRARADEITALGKTARPGEIAFPEFCETYLGMRLFPHQLQWADLLERRPPRDLHPAQTFKPGDPSRVVVNTPPFHAKSMTISIAWVTYRVCLDPNVRIILVSQTEKMAKKFLGAVKTRLTHPRYAALQRAFGPDGGWQATAESWTATEIYIGAEKRDSGEKDPTVQAIGIGGQIYGARADVVILDDTVTRKNAHQWEDQLDWINTEVDSRIEEDTGIMVVVGTRIAPEDLYVKLRDPDDFAEAEDDVVHDGESEERPWTYLSQPAVLEYADRPADWVTLWPRSTMPWSTAQQPDAEGLYPRWDGVRLARKRRKGARIWSLVYQQADVADDAVFPAYAVQACVDPRRNMGPLDGAIHSRRDGMHGLHVVAGLDPAGAGYTAIVVVGVDRTTRMRYVLYAVNQLRMAPHEMRAKMIALTDLLGIDEWVVEKNAYQSSIAKDEDLIAPMRERGVRIGEHFTGAQKWDEDFGVAAMATLFGEYDTERRLVLDPKIELASTQNAHAMKSLVEQLITWQPNPPKTQKTDLVMALWFPLDVSTPLWTESGWKTIGTVEVGDRVATQSGEIATVSGLTAITRQPVYRVTMSDGTSLRADDRHRWWVQPISRGGEALPHRWMTTEEMRSHAFKRLRIDNPKAIETEPVALPVDPYVLGVWLGDGSSQQGTIYGHADDTPHIRAEFEKAGYDTTDQKRAYCFGTLGLRGDLARAGILGNKHVPDAYLRGSVDQRLALLQGLMDTDGTVTPGRSRCYFANTNKQIVDSVAFLARSLGFRVNIQEVPHAGPHKTHWRVLFTADRTTPNPFRLPRKADRVTAFANDRRPRRHLIVKSVEFDGEADVRCIEVDHPSHVFLAGEGLVPTGNCELRAREITSLARGKRVTHMPNRFGAPRRLAQRQVVNLRDYVA